jgi:hypothetical protein
MSSVSRRTFMALLGLGGTSVLLNGRLANRFAKADSASCVPPSAPDNPGQAVGGLFSDAAKAFTSLFSVIENPAGNVKDATNTVASKLNAITQSKSPASKISVRQFVIGSSKGSIQQAAQRLSGADKQQIKAELLKAHAFMKSGNYNAAFSLPLIGDVFKSGANALEKQASIASNAWQQLSRVVQEAPSRIRAAEIKRLTELRRSGKLSEDDIRRIQRYNPSRYKNLDSSLFPVSPINPRPGLTNPLNPVQPGLPQRPVNPRPGLPDPVPSSQRLSPQSVLSIDGVNLSQVAAYDEIEAMVEAYGGMFLLANLTSATANPLVNAYLGPQSNQIASTYFDGFGSGGFNLFMQPARADGGATVAVAAAIAACVASNVAAALCFAALGLVIILAIGIAVLYAMYLNGVEEANKAKQESCRLLSETGTNSDACVEAADRRKSERDRKAQRRRDSCRAEWLGLANLFGGCDAEYGEAQSRHFEMWQTELRGCRA